MALLDSLLTVAVPFVFLCLVAGKVIRVVALRRGVYSGPEGAARRDAVNQRFRTNRGAAVIGVIFLVLWGLTVAALVQEWGAAFFTFVVSVLLLLPFATVSVCVVMAYMFAVHAFAKMTDR